MYVAEYGDITSDNFKKYKQYMINAIKATYRDGYTQYIYIDKDDEIGIKRIYPNCLREWNKEKALFKTVITYKLGVQHISIKEVL